MLFAVRNVDAQDPKVIQKKKQLKNGILEKLNRILVKCVVMLIVNGAVNVVANKTIQIGEKRK